MNEKERYCELCSEKKSVDELKPMRKVVVHREYDLRETFYKCYSCGCTFAYKDLLKPLRGE